jgi:hypothetical protein
MAPRRSKVQPATGQPAPVQPATVQRAPAQRVPVQPATGQRAPVQPQEEDIDLDVSDTSEEEEIAPTAQAMAPAISALDDLMTHVAPIVKPVVKSNRALDIDLLFERGKGKPSVCKYCK